MSRDDYPYQYHRELARLRHRIRDAESEHEAGRYRRRLTAVRHGRVDPS